MAYASPSFSYNTPQGNYSGNFSVPTFQDFTGTSLPDLSTLINNLSMQRAAQAGQIATGLQGQQIAGQEALQAPPLKEQGREFDVGAGFTRQQLEEQLRQSAFQRFLQAQQMFGGAGGGAGVRGGGTGLDGSPISQAEPALMAYNYGTKKYGPLS